ncbi:MAG: histidine phosphatase family protein, partial [Myxococcaceae bacterium]
SEVRGIDGDVALFAHGHVLRVLTARWLQTTPSMGERYALSTASVSVLGREHASEVIWLWNDVSHLQD